MSDNKNKQITLIIVTPYNNFYEGKVDFVSLTSMDGEMGIMYGHQPLVVALSPGIATVRIGDKTKKIILSEGYAEIGQYVALVVVNTAEYPEELDVNRVADFYKEMHGDYEKDPELFYEGSDSSNAYRRSKIRAKAIRLYGTDEQKQLLDKLLGDVDKTNI